MPQIHLRAERGDYASLVLLPGDPNRAQRIAERFDGGLEQTRQVNAHRGLKPLTADHAFSSATSLATTSIPVLYTSTQGILSVDPKLKF